MRQSYGTKSIVPTKWTDRVLKYKFLGCTIDSTTSNRKCMKTAYTVMPIGDTYYSVILDRSISQPIYLITLQYARSPLL